jgi:hypothetical protein
MARIIILDSFPLSTVGKLRSTPPTVTDYCRQWVMDCIAAGNSVRVPAIVYYETLRELERLNAPAQIGRLRAFCFMDPDRFIHLETVHLEEAAKLWGQSRNLGYPTASPQALDGDVILAAQALSLGVALPGLIVATTNPTHVARYVAADMWTNIQP